MTLRAIQLANVRGSTRAALSAVVREYEARVKGKKLCLMSLRRRLCPNDTGHRDKLVLLGHWVQFPRARTSLPERAVKTPVPTSTGRHSLVTYQISNPRRSLLLRLITLISHKSHIDTSMRHLGHCHVYPAQSAQVLPLGSVQVRQRCSQQRGCGWLSPAFEHLHEC